MKHQKLTLHTVPYVALAIAAFAFIALGMVAYFKYKMHHDFTYLIIFSVGMVIAFFVLRPVYKLWKLVNTPKSVLDKMDQHKMYPSTRNWK